MLERITSVPLFQPAAAGTPFPTLIKERVSLRNKDSGLGFRPIAKRFLFLNSINLTMPQALDRKNKKDAIIPGIWNSLSRILGAHSFDEVNGPTRWRIWQNSGSSLAAEVLGLIARVKLSFSSACLALGKNPGENSVLTVVDEGFGFNVNKLHRAINDKLNDLQLEQFTKCVQCKLPKDDQRRKAFEASDNFSNSFPISIDSSVILDSNEFTTAIQRKLGCAVTMLVHSSSATPSRPIENHADSGSMLSVTTLSLPPASRATMLGPPIMHLARW